MFEFFYTQLSLFGLVPPREPEPLPRRPCKPRVKQQAQVQAKISPPAPIPVWPAIPKKTQVVPSNRKTAKAQVVGEVILIEIPRDWPEQAARKATRSLKLQVANHVRQPVLRELVDRINRETVNVEVTDVSFSHRQNRSRIGSININTGRMRLSHRIAEVEPEVLRYLIVHELVHLIYPNHSRAFWQEVARHVPAYKELRRRLQEAFARPRR